MIRTYLRAALPGAVFAVVLLGFAVGGLDAESPVALDVYPKAGTQTGSQPTLRADSSLVLIPTHVTEVSGSSVTNLRKENFRIFEDQVEQTVSYFTRDDAPVSVGLLFDVSGSMRNKMHTACEAVASFFTTSNREDEFFLIEFGERAKLVAPFTGDSGELYDIIAHTKPWGRTALLDAVHLGLKHMAQARNPRKAIVIISDGGDNRSRHSVREIKNAVLESDVQVYAMGIFDREEAANAPGEERNGPRLLDELAEQSGGRHYALDNLSDLPAISAKIGNELRNEYLLGYYPNHFSRDGKYHQIKVQLVSGSPDLRTYYRRGYHAPTQ
jgi:VWFA-related protein